MTGDEGRTLSGDEGHFLNLYREAIQSAKQFDQFSLVALVGVSGGGIVIGNALGGLAWLLFGVAAPMAALKIALRFGSEQVRSAENGLQLFDLALERAIRLSESTLNQENRAAFERVINEYLAAASSAIGPSFAAPPPTPHQAVLTEKGA